MNAYICNNFLIAYYLFKCLTHKTRAIDLITRNFDLEIELNKKKQFLKVDFYYLRKFKLFLI